MATCCIALGGNIGDTRHLFDRALKSLDSGTTRIIHISSILRSTAMGHSAGGDFQNAAAVVETSLQPAEFLERLHQIETALGRQRGIRWGPRPIDLDLLLYDQQIIDTASLVVPHPSFWYRWFVLEPLVQVAPTIQHPILKQSIRQLRSYLDPRPLQIAVPDLCRVDLDVQTLQQTLDDHFGLNRVKLTVQPADDSILATIKLDLSRNIPIPPRAQPPHEPDRSIRLAVQSDPCQARLAETLTDVVSAALG